MKVCDLEPGMRIELQDMISSIDAVFIAQCDHPIYRGLRLVIWKLNDGTVSFDALKYYQELIGRLVDESGEVRRDNWLSAIRS